jgi:hypothetical protein
VADETGTPPTPSAGVPPEVLAAATKAVMEQCQQLHATAEWHARVALEAAAPLLADTIASAILRHADENEPEPGSRGYPAWHRHFEAASAVAAKAFGRDNLEAVPGEKRSEEEGP